MIDSASIAPLKNTVEKLIVLYLKTAYRPMRLVEIVKALGINRQGCSRTLKKLEDNGIIIKQTEFDTDFYILPHVPNMVYTVHHGVSPITHVDSPVPNMVYPVHHEVSPVPPSVSSPPPSFSSKVPTTNLTLVNLTEPNKTNKQDFENSLNSQARVGTTGTGSEVVLGTTDLLEVGAGSAVVNNSPVGTPAPAAPLPQQPPKSAPRCKQTPKTTPSTLEPENAPESPRTEIYDLLPAHARETIKANIRRGKETTDIVNFVPESGIIINSENPTSSLYRMIAFMEHRTCPNPDYETKSLSEIGGEPDVIPMYEAFVKYLHRLHKLTIRHKEKRENPVNDFILHRAAFMFVTGSHRTGELFHSPETFVKLAKERSGKKPLYVKMVCMLKDHYERIGFGWDSTPLTNEETYRAETLYAAYNEKDARDELFPSFIFERGMLRCKVNHDMEQAMERQRIAEKERENEVRCVQHREHLRLEREADESQKKRERALKILNGVRGLAPDLEDTVWKPFTREKLQEVLSCLTNEESAELTALVPLRYCKGLGIDRIDPREAGLALAHRINAKAKQKQAAKTA